MKLLLTILLFSFSHFSNATENKVHFNISSTNHFNLNHSVDLNTPTLFYDGFDDEEVSPFLKKVYHQDYIILGKNCLQKFTFYFFKQSTWTCFNNKSMLYKICVLRL